MIKTKVIESIDLSRPQGFALLPLMAAIAAIGVVSVAAYGVFTAASAITAHQQFKHQTVALIQQAAYVLMAEGGDVDSDGTKEVSGWAVSAIAPTGGGIISLASVAPKLDGWGNVIGYCPYDNGTLTGLANHLAGDTPGTGASISFILMSPGKNGKFDTSCAQAKAGTPQGDDFVFPYTVAQGLKGGSGLLGFGDPVPDDTELAQVSSPVSGEIRLVTQTGLLKEWTGTVWQQVGGIATGPAVNYRAPVAYLSELPTTGNANSDTRVVIAENAIYTWRTVGQYWSPHLSIASRFGTLWTWGLNGTGQLGLGDIAHRSSPVQVGTGLDWQKILCGGSVCSGLKTNGSLWLWGSNTYGTLGDGTTTNKSSPIQLGVLNNWSSVSKSSAFNGIKTDGTLWAWGSNNYGQLGLGDTANRSSPVQVGTLTDWKYIIHGTLHCLALKNDGTLWSWGQNNYGQLGFGDTANRSAPSKVGVLTNWKQITSGYNHSMAVKTDGTLWSWGQNNYGQLGLGDVANRFSPVQVGALTNWQSIGAGLYHTTAVKTDGTLWAWGLNSSGQLGLGDVTNRSSPVQVGALTNWKTVTIGGYHVSTIKTDGTLWSWGWNNYGQLGLGDTANRSSPVQVGGSKKWLSLSAANLTSAIMGL